MDHVSKVHIADQSWNGNCYFRLYSKSKELTSVVEAYVENYHELLVTVREWSRE